jgi:pimeloyl-ACP methyl ester carboxylesterase
MTDVAQRLARGDRLLGVLVPATGFPPAAATGLDVAVLQDTVPARTVAALAATGALIIDAEAAAAVEPAPRIVTSTADARAAFAAGARFVLYDGAAMLDAAFAGLATGRAAGPELGDRQPLVLLSGMLGDESLWDGVAAGLTDVARPWPARIDLDDSVPEMADSVLAVAPERFALAGHSLGGIVALEIVRRAPQRVTRLALINTSARGPSETQLAGWAQLQERVGRGEFDPVADELAVATLARAHRAPDLVTRNRRMAGTVGADGLLRQLAAQATRPDSRPTLAGIEVPVLVVSAAADDICPPDLQQELAARCPAAELVSVPGSGHMTPLEAPEALTAHLRRWLGAGQ